MHIRSRTSAADLARTRERRAWGSLFLSIALGVAAVAASLRLHCPRRAAGGAGTCTPVALLQEESATAPPQQTAITVPPPPVPDFPFPAVQAIAAPPLAIDADLPPLDFPETDSTDTLSALLPEVRMPAPRATHTPAPLAPALAQPRPRPATVALSTTPAETAIPPAYKCAPAPPYPAALRSSHIEGSVRVRIAVDAAGRPSQVEVISGSGHSEFDTCARQWILEHWLFIPARRGSQAIPGSVTTSVRFVLH